MRQLASWGGRDVGQPDLGQSSPSRRGQPRVGADITEELTRLRVHLRELRALLDGDAPVGRPMDFLIQEINREVNTIGSKADDLDISQAVIAAKSVLEKIREQAQNIE